MLRTIDAVMILCNMLFRKKTCLFFCWLFIVVCLPVVKACAVGEHHSATYHYNTAQKVFLGLLLKKEKLHQSDTLLLTFKVLVAYKNCEQGQLLSIQSTNYASVKLRYRGRYLVYAEQAQRQALFCPQLEPFQAAITRRQLEVIERIRNHPPNVPFMEYSPYGNVWVKGYYNQGIPEANWVYYAYSGEVKLTAYYQNGKPAHCWETYIHTDDKTYELLQKIISSKDTQQWQGYQLVRIDTSMNTKFRYTLHYLLEGDTIVEAFYYNQPYCTQYSSYKNGLKHGVEYSFKEDGIPYKRYTFYDGQLHGSYSELLTWKYEKGIYVEVKGEFVSNKRYQEEHHYYNKEGEFLYKKTIIEKGKILE